MCCVCDGLSMRSQPPSGGCVLKLTNKGSGYTSAPPAAFRRLCVETALYTDSILYWAPAAFRRLCVETPYFQPNFVKLSPAAFRRLCVETIFCAGAENEKIQPPSGGCVLKRDSLPVRADGATQPPSGGWVLKQG